METKHVLDALAALSQETRLAIFRLLVETGPAGLAVGAIAERLVIANATLSFHLKELSNAGLLTATPNGRSIIYAADFATMNGLVDYLTENCCGGASCSPGASPVPCATDCAPKKSPVRKTAIKRKSS